MWKNILNAYWITYLNIRSVKGHTEKLIKPRYCDTCLKYGAREYFLY